MKRERAGSIKGNVIGCNSRLDLCQLEDILAKPGMHRDRPGMRGIRSPVRQTSARCGWAWVTKAALQWS